MSCESKFGEGYRDGKKEGPEGFVMQAVRMLASMMPPGATNEYESYMAGRKEGEKEFSYAWGKETSSESSSGDSPCSYSGSFSSANLSAFDIILGLLELTVVLLILCWLVLAIIEGQKPKSERIYFRPPQISTEPWSTPNNYSVPPSKPKNKSYPFKGIDPPIAHRDKDDTIAELMTTPTRELTFMGKDETTGVKFYLVTVFGGLPDPIPCIGGTKWSGGYEILGEVPTEIDLADENTAKSLIYDAKFFLFKFCPKAESTKETQIWLFKKEIPKNQSSDYEVYARWFTNMPNYPGPRVEFTYQNKAKREVQ